MDRYLMPSFGITDGIVCFKVIFDDGLVKMNVMIFAVLMVVMVLMGYCKF